MSEHMSRLDAIKARLADRSDCRNTADLKWAVEEIDHLRRYLDVLGEFAFAADRLRWALENPKPGRVERCRRSFEKAQRELLASPTWRPGECRGGCRRYATHVFVVEQDGGIEREACCQECGEMWLAVRQAAIDAGWQPDGVLRLEPIALSNVEAREVVQ